MEEQLAAWPDCYNSAPYLAQIGRLLNAQRNYPEALDHLERALMLDPSLAQAQLDYAIALAGTGSTLSARLLIDGILTQYNLAPDLRAQLLQARRSILQAQSGAVPSPYTLNLDASLRQGYDSNLLASPKLSSLALTLGADTVIFDLADSLTPRAGSYTRADTKLRLHHQNSNASHWNVTANLMQRRSPAVPQANLYHGEFMLEYAQPLAAQWLGYLHATAALLDTHAGARYASKGLAVGLAAVAPGNPCRTRTELEWQARNASTNSVLSGDYIGLNTHLDCAPVGHRPWQISASVGQDHPQQTARPGGLQHLASLRALGLWPDSRLLLDLELRLTRDTTGYSPLLDNGAVRNTRQLAARLEYQYPLGPQLGLTVGGEWFRQASNLPLFRIQSWGGYTALRFSW